MIKYPVVIGNPDAHTFTVEDSSGRVIASGVDNEEEITALVNALNGMHEFPKGLDSAWFSFKNIVAWYNKFFSNYVPTHEDNIQYLKSIGRECHCDECADT